MGPDHKKLKKSVISGVYWTGIEVFGNKFTQLLISIILARILMPETFGVIALTGVFVTLAEVLAEGGFRSVLIQRQNCTREDYSTVFWLNTGIGLLAGLAVCAAAAPTAQFYDSAVLDPIMKVLSLVIMFHAWTVVPSARLYQQMQFRKVFFINFISLVISGAAAVAMAAYGAGVWALVGQQLLRTFLVMAMMWKASNWWPGMVFSAGSFRALTGFGSKLLGSSFINALFDNIYPAVIVKVFSMESLAFYNRGVVYPRLVQEVSAGTVAKVTLPAFSALSQDPERARAFARRVLTMMFFVIAPALFCLAASAEAFVKVILTDKWLPCVIFLKLSCFAFLFMPLQAVNVQITVALRHGTTMLMTEALKKICLVAGLLVTIPFGLEAVTAGTIGVALASFFINAIPVNRMIGYSWSRQLADIMPYILVSALVFAPVQAMAYLRINAFALLFLQLSAFGLLYLICCRLFRLESLFYAWRHAVEKLAAMKGALFAR